MRSNAARNAGHRSRTQKPGSPGRKKGVTGTGQFGGVAERVASKVEHLSGRAQRAFQKQGRKVGSGGGQ